MGTSYRKYTNNWLLCRRLNRKRISPEELEELANDTDKESGEEEENKKIFQELNDIVIQKQLYLSSELSREDLAQIVHLNNARLRG